LVFWTLGFISIQEITALCQECPTQHLAWKITAGSKLGYCGTSFRGHSALMPDATALKITASYILYFVVVAAASGRRINGLLILHLGHIGSQSEFVTIQLFLMLEDYICIVWII
jgi:hypothetical protein